MKKKLLIIFWVILILSIIYLSIFHITFFKNLISQASNFSIYFGYGLFLLFGIFRSFTFIPSTYLIAIGLLFFPPLPLFILSLSGILISSLFVYYFFGHLNLKRLFTGKSQKYYTKAEKLLAKNEFPVVFFWSLAPFLPTDLICYACGIAKVNLKKFIFGILLGEGIICAIYIFSGNLIIQQLKIFLLK